MIIEIISCLVTTFNILNGTTELVSKYSEKLNTSCFTGTDINNKNIVIKTWGRRRLVYIRVLVVNVILSLVTR